jgi:hypothetical protein
MENILSQELFNYIAETFNHTPLQSEMNDLRQIIRDELIYYDMVNHMDIHPDCAAGIIQMIKTY